MLQEVMHTSCSRYEQWGTISQSENQMVVYKRKYLKHESFLLVVSFIIRLINEYNIRTILCLVSENTVEEIKMREYLRSHEVDIIFSDIVDDVDLVVSLSPDRKDFNTLLESRARFLIVASYRYRDIRQFSKSTKGDPMMLSDYRVEDNIHNQDHMLYIDNKEDSLDALDAIYFSLYDTMYNIVK